MTRTAKPNVFVIASVSLLGVLLLARMAWAQPAPADASADGQPAAGATDAQTAANLPPGTMVMRRVVINDPQTGLDAYSIMAPVGWTTKGQVVWQLDRPSAPMSFVVHTADAGNTEGFTEFPSQVFVWSQVDSMFAAQAGGKVEGCPIVAPADGPIDAIERVILPQLQNVVGQISVVSTQDLPDVAQAYAPTYAQPGQPAGQTLAGKVRIEYTENGLTKQAEIVCVFIKSESPSGVVWGMDHLSVVYAPKGSLDQELPKLNFILASLQENPHFDAAVTEVSRELVEEAQEHLAAVMEQSQIREAAAEQMSAEQEADWQANEKARFDAVENYDTGAVRGMMNMKDPHDGSIVQVPDDALHAWSNGNEVIWTSDPNFKPSMYDNSDWQEVQPTNESGY